MAVSTRAKLPLLFSALMGLCVLGTSGYALSGQISQHAEGAQIVATSLFALLVFAVWLWGFVRSVRLLSGYAQEEAALPKAKTALETMAHEVEAGNWNRQDLAAETPLLDRRFTPVWRTLHRGAPLLSGESGESEARPFPGPEREIRTYQDIALSVGIVGTFVSLLITLGQLHLTGDLLLARVGADMTGVLVGVIANIGLRICHRAVQDEQDLLMNAADEAVFDGFVSLLPKAVTSPEERIVTATRELALHATATLEKQASTTQVTLTHQAEQYDTLLKAYARQIATILLQQLQTPIQQIADQTKALAQQSATWAAAVSDLKTAHAAYLKAQTDGQTQHEQRLTTTFAQYHKALDLSLQVVKQANDDALQQTQEFTKRLAGLQLQELKEMTAEWQTQFTALQAKQEQANQRLTEAAIAAMGSAVEARLTTLDERVTTSLNAIENRLPTSLRDGMKEALVETISLIDSLREQTAEMAHTLGQVSDRADRQLQAYGGWYERGISVQDDLAQIVTKGQAAQAAQLIQWQTDAAQTLEGIRAAFDGTIHTAQSGFTNLVAALDPLTAELQRLQTITQELNSALSAALPSSMTQTTPTPDAPVVPASTPMDPTTADPDIPVAPNTPNASPSALPEWARPSVR